MKYRPEGPGDPAVRARKMELAAMVSQIPRSPMRHDDSHPATRIVRAEEYHYLVHYTGGNRNLRGRWMCSCGEVLARISDADEALRRHVAEVRDA